MALLIPCSILPIKKYCYEVFLVVHIVLALGALVLLFFHVTIMDGQYDSYLWVTSGVWVSHINSTRYSFALSLMSLSGI